jgi:hypothetical protein
MNLHDLLEEEFFELDARVNSVSLDEIGDLRLEIEYDDEVMPKGKRRAELKCVQAKEFNVTPNFVGSLEVFDNHTLLSDHHGAQAHLYFSSAPKSPTELFYLCHSTLTKEFSNWRNPAAYLNGKPDELLKHLAGGYGLLARGPFNAMEALANAVGSLLTVNLVESHVLQSTAKVLTLDQQYVICQSVEVFRNVS